MTQERDESRALRARLEWLLLLGVEDLPVRKAPRESAESGPSPDPRPAGPPDERRPVLQAGLFGGFEEVEGPARSGPGEVDPRPGKRRGDRARPDPLFPSAMVPRARFELARLAAPPPQDGVSTSSTTWACRRGLAEGLRGRKHTGPGWRARWPRGL